MNKVTIAHLVIILLLGVITRFAFLDSVPGNLHPDSVDTIRIYLEHRFAGNFSLLSTNWNGSHIINQLMIAIPWEVMGMPYWAVQMGPALISIICLLAFYLLVKSWLNNAVIALLSTLLLMVDPWFLNFSRSGWENIANCLGVILLLYSFTPHSKKHGFQKILMVLVAMGSPYLYHPGKIIAFTALIALVVVSLKEKIALSKKFIQLLIIFILLSLSIMPMFFIDSVNQFGRITTVSIFSEIDVKEALLFNLKNNWLGFLTFQPEQWSIGINSRYVPLDSWIIHPVVVLLFMVGIIYTVWKRWWLVGVGLLLIVPVNVFSNNTPDAARTIHALPYIYLMSTLGAHSLYLLIKRFYTSKFCIKPVIRMVFLGSVVTGVLGLMSIQLLHYWNWITDPKTLVVREPAVYSHEYDRWLNDTFAQLKNTGRTLSIYEWRDAQTTTLSN